jgi:hypothetical protein
MPSIPPRNVLNRIKEKTSQAYLHALIAKVNYHLNAFEREFDELGFDYAIINKPVGEGRSVASESNEIKVQLKSVSSSSTTMYRENGDSIKYKLGSPLEPLKFGSLYIFLICLPGENEHDLWVEINPKELIIKRCAYYYKVTGRIEPGFITIPKTNILDEDSFPSLFA